MKGYFDSPWIPSGTETNPQKVRDGKTKIAGRTILATDMRLRVAKKGFGYQSTEPPAFIDKLPPSTGRRTPVTMEAASDARKIAGPTTSSG